MRPSPSTSTIRGAADRSAAAPITSPIRAGRNYDRMPVNANEAEARRRARFFAIGHTGGSTPEPRTLDNPEHPLTLDLRRPQAYSSPASRGSPNRSFPLLFPGPWSRWRGLSSSPASAYDELVTGQKSIRYHWQGILSVIRSLPNGLGERGRECTPAARGIGRHGQSIGRSRCRPLDLRSAADGHHADEMGGHRGGLIQRARLLDRVLADVYGAQTLLKQKLLPPMLVHANRHFLRPPGSPTAPRPSGFSANYAVDLVRLSNGRWHVLADHAELPAGVGYALEMRRVLAAAFRRHSAPFPCATCGRSSTAGTSRCARWRRPPSRSPIWRS